jgi:pimeloyl-ACP methyl ester carboxylesterase
MITHIKDPNSDKCIVFVHGLGGSKYTFKKFAEYLNSKWSLEYGFLTFYFDYYKGIFALFGNNSLSKIIFIFKVILAKRNLHNANELDKYIDINCADCKDIVLVAHSMGGLVSRQYLVNCRNNQKDIRKIKMLITYATPHNGSHVANHFSFLTQVPIVKQIYSFISRLLKTRIFPQIGDLTTFSSFINNLNEEWTKFDLERKVKFIRVVANYDQLVKSNSANLHDRDVVNIHNFDYDHFTLISPPSNSVQFDPINLLIERIGLLTFSEEYFSELDAELNYDELDHDTY